MFNKIITAIKDMWVEKKEACIVALIYLVWIALFYFIGITQVQFDALVAFVLVTGIYALFVWFYFKYFRD